MTDLILRGGRVIDPASGRDQASDIAFGEGKVIELGRELASDGGQIVDVLSLIHISEPRDRQKSRMPSSA